MLFIIFKIFVLKPETFDLRVVNTCKHWQVRREGECFLKYVDVLLTDFLFLCFHSWDDSSSVSSGISDTIDTDDINTSSSISSYANTPAATRKALSGQVSDSPTTPGTAAHD